MSLDLERLLRSSTLHLVHLLLTILASLLAVLYLGGFWNLLVDIGVGLIAIFVILDSFLAISVVLPFLTVMHRTTEFVNANLDCFDALEEMVERR